MHRKGWTGKKTECSMEPSPEPTGLAKRAWLSFSMGRTITSNFRLWNWGALTLCRFGFFPAKSREEATSTFFPTTATRFGAYARVTCSNTCSEESKVRQCKGMPGRTWFWSGTALLTRLYKNGQLDASAEVSADNDAFSVIGAYLPTAEALDDREPFHGMIDDLLVWDRALTSIGSILVT